MFKKTINQILLRIDKYQQIIYSEISGAAEGGATKMLWWNMSLWRGEKIIPSPFYYLKNKAVNDCAFEKGRLSLCCYFSGVVFTSEFDLTWDHFSFLYNPFFLTPYSPQPFSYRHLNLRHDIAFLSKSSIYRWDFFDKIQKDKLGFVIYKYH